MFIVKNIINHKKSLWVLFGLMLLVFSFALTFYNGSVYADDGGSCYPGDVDTGSECYKEVVHTGKVGTCSPSNPSASQKCKTSGGFISSPTNTTGSGQGCSIDGFIINSNVNKNAGGAKKAGWNYHSSDKKCWWHYYEKTDRISAANTEARGAGVDKYTAAAIKEICGSKPDASCERSVTSTVETCTFDYWDSHRNITPPDIGDGNAVAQCIASKFSGHSIGSIKSALSSAKEAANDAAKERARQYCESKGLTYDTSNDKADSNGCVAAEDESSCKIDGLGWIVCPAMNFLATVNDVAFGFISSQLLEINTVDLFAKTEGGKTSTQYGAWQAFRNIANVVFVILFLIIIYSQMTGGGNK